MGTVLEGFETVRRVRLQPSGLWLAQVLPGEFYVTRSRELISTVLGSCVSVTACDLEAGVGGLNHFLLPLARQVEAGPVTRSTRYGVQAMEMLLNALYRHGASRDRLVFKAFGGGRVTHVDTDVGERNVAFVRRFLGDEGFEAQVTDLGGRHARRLIYDPTTGRARVKRIPMTKTEDIARRDLDLLEEVSREGEDLGGGVDLF